MNIRAAQIGIGQNKTCLHDVYLYVEKGSFVQIIGGTGSGKTLLLSMIGLLTGLPQGHYKLMGEDIAKCTPKERLLLRQHIGFVHQDLRLLDHLSIYDNVALPMRFLSDMETEIRDRVEELLCWFSLQHTAKARPCDLSMGEKALVALSRALLRCPKLILVDQAFDCLDKNRKRKVFELLGELKNLGQCVVMTASSRVKGQNMDSQIYEIKDQKLLKVAV